MWHEGEAYPNARPLDLRQPRHRNLGQSDQATAPLTADSGLEPRGFYREVLSQFGITPEFHQRDARRQFDHAFMDAYENQGKQPVLVIDEAHLLSASMLAEVRFLTNFQFDSLNPFALILVGRPELRATLRLRAFEAVRQRVSVRYHLGGWRRKKPGRTSSMSSSRQGHRGPSSATPPSLRSTPYPGGSRV